MSDALSEFLVQLPPGLIVLACAPFLLLMSYFILAVYLRGRRASRNAQQPTANAKNAQPAAADGRGLAALEALQAVRRDYDPEDLPELDVLVQSAAQPAPEATPRQRVLSSQPLPVRLNTGEAVQAKEVLTVLRDERDGRLMILVGDVAYRSLANAPETKRTYNRLMNELDEMIVTPDEPPVEADQVPLPAALDAKPDPEAGAYYRNTPPPPTTPDGRMPGDLPSYRFDDNPAKIQSKGLGRQKVEFEAPPALDIATAIETYLQYRISYTPEFRGRNIHVLPSLDGGVRIQVDDRFYDAVDEIRDPETRAFIQTAIAEWQERQ